MHPKTRGNRVFVAVALAAGLLVPAASVGAEDSPPLAGPPAEPTPAAARAQAAFTPATAPDNAGESEQDELSRRATDPTASPPSFAGIGEWTTGYRDLAHGTPVDEDGFAVRFQAVVPFKAWGVANILRMTVPSQVSGPGKSGLGDPTSSAKFRRSPASRCASR